MTTHINIKHDIGQVSKCSSGCADNKKDTEKVQIYKQVNEPLSGNTKDTE